MIVQQFFVEGIAHSSYLLAGEKTCAIIDPRRDVEVYLDAARKWGLNITYILETHLHADFVSGHIDLAEFTGARIYVPARGVYSFECELLSEGDTIELEDMEITTLETPGHTPEHISYVVVDTSRGDKPAAVFCGDTLFVGDVGRPDLFPGQARKLASQSYDSLHEKLAKLADFCEVYPAHGAGSLCGRTMAAKRTSTIGYERLYNPALQIRDREMFGCQHSEGARVQRSVQSRWRHEGLYRCRLSVGVSGVQIIETIANLTNCCYCGIIRNMSNYRKDDIQKLTEMFKALSNPHRLSIFLRLVMCCSEGTQWDVSPEGCVCVGELGQDLGIAPSTVSHHIKELHRAGLIRTERAGQQIKCWIDPGTLRYLAEFFSRPACE